ncbi:MAG: uroporphyrinogen decarboxylase family protein, partial [Anaerolineales bacterium]
MTRGVMDGKARVRAALAHEEADRVPLYEGAFSSSIASQILGREVFVPSNGGSSFRHFLLAHQAGIETAREAAVKSAHDGVELYARLGIDMIRVRITDFLTPVDFGYGNYGSNALFDSEIKTLSENRWRIEGPEGMWSDHVFEADTDAMMCVDHAILHDANEGFERYVELLERTSTALHKRTEVGLAGVRAAVEAGREKGVFILGWGDVAYPGSSPWLTEFLVSMRTDPSLVARYMEVTTEGALVFIHAQIEAGVDGILGGNDWCFKSGPMFSLDDFRQFFVPHLRRIVQACHENGVPYIKHLDGNTNILLDSLVDEVGIDGYHGIEPPAGMDIFDLKTRYGSKITLLGNLDCGEILSNGSQEQIEAETRRILRHVSPGGGHVFGSSNSI